mmetsp:Transcript_9332/g.14044  ORF Transcript_9332/g.14044 Transcript_9332/m.14044 type:complete len:295 (-) Transcript_9332:12816-13700(-)
MLQLVANSPLLLKNAFHKSRSCSLAEYFCSNLRIISSIAAESKRPSVARPTTSLVPGASCLLAQNEHLLSSLLLVIPATTLLNKRRFRAFCNHNFAMLRFLPSKGIRVHSRLKYSISSSSSLLISERSPNFLAPSPIAISRAYTSRTYSSTSPSDVTDFIDRGVRMSSRCCIIHARFLSRKRCLNDSLFKACNSILSRSSADLLPSPIVNFAAISTSIAVSTCFVVQRPRHPIQGNCASARKRRKLCVTSHNPNMTNIIKGAAGSPRILYWALRKIVTAKILLIMARENSEDRK